jgi:Raf kinase inhibitor-like YbhB/YbcL family protein
VSRAAQRRRDRGPGRRPWRRVRAGAAGLTALALVSGCGLIGGSKSISSNVPDKMTVTSQAFSPHLFPTAYTCHGPGHSPSLHWSGAPEGTKSLALLVDDASAPIQPYIYWIVFDIGSQTTGIQAGQVPPGARQADSSKGTDRYDPPCPVNGLHTYRFTVYALSRSLSLPEGVAMKTAWSAIAQAAIARGRLQTTASP